MGHYSHNLMMACAAQHLWNPDAPDEYEYITTTLVPRAAKFLYGRAWREMAEFVVNLNIRNFTVHGNELVRHSSHPGFWEALGYNWDAGNSHYHSLDSAEVTRNDAVQSALCKGRVFCADYGQFRRGMRYEHEIGIRAHGLGYETLTLIPKHDTGFSPVRNGPPYGAGGGVPAVSNVRIAPCRLSSAFRTALVAPPPDVPAKAVELDYASDKVVWEGDVDGGGLLGAFDPASNVYLLLLADPKVRNAAASVQQHGAQDWPGESLTIRLLRPVVNDWPAGSRNTFKRSFAAGEAKDIEAALQASANARRKLMADDGIKASGEPLPVGGDTAAQRRNAALLSEYDYSKYPTSITGFTGQDLQHVAFLQYRQAIRTRVGPRGNYKAEVHVYLTELSDGRVLATYSNYHRAYASCAMVSADGGKAWDRDNAVVPHWSADLYVGWPVTLEMPNGSLMTSYATTTYLKQPPDTTTCEVVRWRLPE